MKIRIPLGIFAAFATIALLLWHFTGVALYLFNFLYIGACVSTGIALTLHGNRHARRFVQLSVGLYMLAFFGLVHRENMQLEGFFYYLSLGAFQGAVIHYSVAKIFGPFLFGRGWCGYACWTAMVLDLLPFSTPTNPRKKALEGVRYLMFLASVTVVFSLVWFKVANIDVLMLRLFILGNALYYIAGILMAYALKDNRAFCKYGCPITVFLKPASYYSLLRIKVDESKCIKCGKCLKACPMDVDMLDIRRSRKNGTECILCMACVKVCPVNALR